MIERILIRAPTKLKNALKEIAEEKGMTVNGLILNILWDWWESDKK